MYYPSTDISLPSWSSVNQLETPHQPTFDHHQSTINNQQPNRVSSTNNQQPTTTYHQSINQQPTSKNAQYLSVKHVSRTSHHLISAPSLWGPLARSSYSYTSWTTCLRRPPSLCTTAIQPWMATRRRSTVASIRRSRSTSVSFSHTEGTSNGGVSTGAKSRWPPPIRRLDPPPSYHNNCWFYSLKKNLSHTKISVHLPCELESRETHICTIKWTRNDKSCIKYTFI